MLTMKRKLENVVTLVTNEQLERRIQFRAMTLDSISPVKVLLT